jgi:hypothetical protein
MTVDDRLHDARRIEQTLREQTARLIASMHDLSEKTLSMQQHLDHLTRIVVSMRRLLEARDERDAIVSVREIVMTLVGSEDFVVYGAVAHGRAWAPLTGMGRSHEHAQAAGTAPGYVTDWLLERGSARVREDGSAIWDNGVVACVPLTLVDGLYGAIVIHRLLSHRPPLGPKDEELLMLLGTIAPVAILSARHRLEWRREHALDRTGLR